MNRKKTIILIAVMCVLPLLSIGVELRWHFAERIIGSYLESRNAERDRLERFVQQEIQTSQALEDVNRLVEIRTQAEQRRQEDSEGNTEAIQANRACYSPHDPTIEIRLSERLDADHTDTAGLVTDR